MENFKLSKFTDEGSKLLADVTAEFKRLKLDTSKLPKVFPDDSGKIKLVFVGQYGTGKSSIIKMLTGEDVEVCAAITTQNFTPYEWHGLEIIDTPGIHTELRPDHDEITYDQINHAALLIFVITNEGFSDRMGKHFFNLAVEQKRLKNMVLVVNKMDRTQLGNVPEQQQVIYEDLKKVTAPDDPKDLYLSFLDTSSYFKALEERDERRKKRRLDKSGYDIFVENLNRFVADKGVMQKIILPLNTIAAVIRAVEGGANDEQKANVAAYIETLRKKKQIIFDEKKYCLDEIKGLVRGLKNKITGYGVEVADAVVSNLAKGDEKSAEAKMNEAQKRIEKMSAEYAEQIDVCTKNFISRIETNIKLYESSNFVKQVNENLIRQFKKQSASFGKGGAFAIGAGGAAAGVFVAAKGAQIATPFAMPAITPLGKFVADFAEIGVRVLTRGAGSFSLLIAKETRNIVTSFPIFRAEKPLVNKLAEFVGGNAKFLGAALGVAAAAISLFMIYRDNKKAEENERNFKMARAGIMDEFEKISDAIGEKILNSVKQWAAQNINPLISKLDEEINAFEIQNSNEQIKNEKLNSLLKRTENLIGEIQACQ